MIRTYYLALLGFLAICLTASADPTFTLTPSGTVSGQPGDSVGWGYSIVNDTGDYMLIENSFFCDPGEDPSDFDCSPGLGASTYQDFIATNFTEIAPNTTGAQSFDASATTGVGEYSIDPSATPGQSDVGSIVIVYDLFTTDFLSPNYTCCQVGGDMEISAAAEVDVTGTGTSPVPEPATQGLVVAGLLLSAVACRRFRFSGSPNASRSSI
jgi:hypothetical protein